MTILNYLQSFKSFVYDDARLLHDDEQPILEEMSSASQQLSKLLGL